jgi:hypothetical protein
MMGVGICDIDAHVSAMNGGAKFTAHDRLRKRR